MGAFQSALESRETQLAQEVSKLRESLVANASELELRERRINRLTTSVDDMEEGVAIGRVHIKKLTALLNKGGSPISKRSSTNSGFDIPLPI
mmetsp:Transcript_45016/g.70584  ORF Transcript_45016/g.70584 Transcript_45016/m.70584 type:complete len:92 (-) Transcript_45016:136-411(-)